MTREKRIRVDEKDLALLEAARDELDVDVKVPLGYVARRGAAQIVDADEGEVVS